MGNIFDDMLMRSRGGLTGNGADLTFRQEDIANNLYYASPGRHDFVYCDVLSGAYRGVRYKIRTDGNCPECTIFVPTLFFQKHKPQAIKYFYTGSWRPFSDSNCIKTAREYDNWFYVYKDTMEVIPEWEIIGMDMSDLEVGISWKYNDFNLDWKGYKSDKENIQYNRYKWTVQELIGHIKEAVDNFKRLQAIDNRSEQANVKAYLAEQRMKRDIDIRKRGGYG